MVRDLLSVSLTKICSGITGVLSENWALNEGLGQIDSIINAAVSGSLPFVVVIVGVGVKVVDRSMTSQERR